MGLAGPASAAADPHRCGGRLPVPRRARRALAGAGLLSLRDLTGVTRAEVAALHGMGPRALTVLDQALYALGTEFKKVR